MTDKSAFRREQGVKSRITVDGQPYRYSFRTEDRGSLVRARKNPNQRVIVQRGGAYDGNHIVYERVRGGAPKGYSSFDKPVRDFSNRVRRIIRRR